MVEFASGSKIKSINSQTREEIFKTINKSNFLDKISNDIHSIICLHKNKFIYVEKNIMNDTSINKLTERTKMPLLLHVS
ncbi:hypothetical protein [uncultured Arcobacter sp.]|uniref:hypothetical protein n=1 Tax=uncultured Arcobacter sp. TaxID=165434 RepID=UPI002604BB13|nr:hypothetical protein [uncultured Arcobacter sp.]